MINLSGACYTGGLVASSKTNKATVTAKRGAGCRSINMSARKHPLGSLMSLTTTGNGSANVTIAYHL